MKWSSTVFSTRSQADSNLEAFSLPTPIFSSITFYIIKVWLAKSLAYLVPSLQASIVRQNINFRQTILIEIAITGHTIQFPQLENSTPILSTPPLANKAATNNPQINEKYQTKAKRTEGGIPERSNVQN